MSIRQKCRMWTIWGSNRLMSELEWNRALLMVALTSDIHVSMTAIELQKGIRIKLFGGHQSGNLCGWPYDLLDYCTFGLQAVNDAQFGRVDTAWGKDHDQRNLSKKWKSAQRRRRHCALTVEGGAKNFRPAADPLPVGAGRPKFNRLEIGHNLYLQTQFWWGSIHAISSYCVNRPTNTKTHKQTGAITIHCAAVSAQCNDNVISHHI